MFWIYKTDIVNHFATSLNITWKTKPLTWKNTKFHSLVWRQEVLVHLPFITSETGVAGNTIWKGFDQLCPFINNWMGGGLIIEAIIHALHCSRLPMRINREHRLYLAFEASEILSLQHGSCHMGPYSQPTWHLLRSTPANDTYLLPPMMLPPTQVTCHLLSFKSNTMSLLLCFWYFVMLHYSYSFN